MSTKVQIGIALLVVALVGLPLAAKLKYGSAGQAATGSGGTTYDLVSIDGHPIPYAPMHGGGRAPEVSGGSFTINNDGTFTGGIQFSNSNVVAIPPSGQGKGQPGTYTREGNKLMMKHPGAGYTSATIDGEKLTMDNESMLFVYQLKGDSGSQTGSQAIDPNTPSSAVYDGKEVKTSALGAALFSGEREKVLALVRAGADLNSSTPVTFAAGGVELHYTAWHIAFLTILSGKATVDFLQFLFDNGADPLAACPPLDYAFQRPPLLILLSHWDSPKFDAAGNVIGELLIQKGNDVNAQLIGPKSSIPLLNFMVTLKNESAVRFLLSHGAKPNSTGSDGFTALGQAKRKSWTEIISLLQQYGATE